MKTPEKLSQRKNGKSNCGAGCKMVQAIRKTSLFTKTPEKLSQRKNGKSTLLLRILERTAVETERKFGEKKRKNPTANCAKKTVYFLKEEPTQRLLNRWRRKAHRATFCFQSICRLLFQLSKIFRRRSSELLLQIAKNVAASVSQTPALRALDGDLHHVLEVPVGALPAAVVQAVQALARGRDVRVPGEGPLQQDVIRPC